jgi:hypothetical protein
MTSDTKLKTDGKRREESERQMKPIEASECRVQWFWQTGAERRYANHRDSAKRRHI